jgi:phage tail-like protein
MSKPVNHSEPYRDYRFLLYFEGSPSPVAAATHAEGTVKGLGGVPLVPITLERGITQDIDFLRWATAVSIPKKGKGSRRRDVRIEELDEAGQPVAQHLVRRAWVLEFLGLPVLDANSNGVAFERLKLGHAGWEGDPA